MAILIYALRVFAAFFVLGFGILTFVKNKNSSINRAFLKLTIAIFIWLISYALASRISDISHMLIAFKMGFAGIIFIPVTFYEFIATFLNKQRIRLLQSLFWVGGIIFLYFLYFTPLLIADLYHYSWGYYPQANIKMHPLFLCFFIGLFTAGFVDLVLNLLKERNLIQLSKTKYVLLGSIIASFGSVDFIPNYGISLFPLGFIFLVQLPIIFAYAIIKYRLMDVSVAVTRTSIFFVIYSFVLGIPFVLAFGWREQLKSLMGEMWWLAPLISSTVLATVGPSIYLFIQRKAEDRLLQEQRRYQAALRRASLGMGRVKELGKLLNLIVHIVTRTVKIEHSIIYLFHESSSQFVLKASKGIGGDRRSGVIAGDAVLIQHLQKHREPLVYDEVKQRSVDFKDEALAEIGKVMEDLQAALIVPSFMDERLIAFIALGKKKSGKLYSHDDLIVFSILANQAALAIENAQFYEEMKKTHEQLIKAEKMATIGTMADGLSHQINNRLHAMGFIAGDAVDTIRLKKKDPLPPETRELLEEIEHSLDRIQDNVKRGGEIVEGLLKYSRKPEEGFGAVDLNKLLDASLEMVQFKIKLNRIDIVRNFDHAVPPVHVNFTQLQEVFFNIIDNSYDAMMERQEEFKEPGYKGRLEITAHSNGQNLEILLSDNGIGVRPQDINKLFTPFFTTKLSSKKGTGLGLYVMRKIIEENHQGKVEFTSEYKEGSRTRLVLPIAT
ncbi:MAG: hypothetical protein A3G91_01520 [Omnitrophica WOR_2 bacterium RIFCSPLOWO2_12_FULL_50_9]|nr:MAG: hypothetical protein A3G91_01520 [Omnitrophica WOR_2 bacterium RIFCSPLOWO2_12_FULL_50_9]